MTRLQWLPTLAAVALMAGCVDYHLRTDRPSVDAPQDTGFPADTDLPDTDPPDTDPPDTDPPDTDPPDTDPPDTDPPQPEAGCSDGTREGYLAWNDYPEIAASNVLPGNVSALRNAIGDIARDTTPPGDRLAACLEALPDTASIVEALVG